MGDYDTPKPTVHVVVENPDTSDCKVKAVFKTMEKAREAIEQEFSTELGSTTYEIESRSLLESITD